MKTFGCNHSICELASALHGTANSRSITSAIARWLKAGVGVARHTDSLVGTPTRATKEEVYPYPHFRDEDGWTVVQFGIGVDLRPQVVLGSLSRAMTGSAGITVRVCSDNTRTVVSFGFKRTIPGEGPVYITWFDSDTDVNALPHQVIIAMAMCNPRWTNLETLETDVDLWADRIDDWMSDSDFFGDGEG